MTLLLFFCFECMLAFTLFFFFNDTATTEIYTLSLHDALPISCRLVLTLSHPDLHWFVPVELERRAADADKQVELAEEALGEVLAARRERPLYGRPSGMASHGIASVRLLLRKLALTPVMGPRKVFVMGDAERLVPQTGAEAAANALLKALEEPPADTVLVLTTAEPDALLATIRSRVVRVRVARLAYSVLTAFALRELGLADGPSLPQRVTAEVGLTAMAHTRWDAGEGVTRYR